jgi:hypothetical protein
VKVAKLGDGIECNQSDNCTGITECKARTQWNGRPKAVSATMEVEVQSAFGRTPLATEKSQCQRLSFALLVLPLGTCERSAKTASKRLVLSSNTLGASKKPSWVFRAHEKRSARKTKSIVFFFLQNQSLTALISVGTVVRTK